jgi:hypothetical protein
MRKLRSALIGLVLGGSCWAIGYAQAAQREPDFEIAVSASAGRTEITCVRGCGMAWVERGINPNAAIEKTFTYGCTGSGVQTCKSGRIGGWIQK